MITVRLTHFLRGQVDVKAEVVDGRREWTCPDRPMMRPWEDCHFTETPEEIDVLWLMASNTSSQVEGVGHNADRLSAIA